MCVPPNEDSELMELAKVQAKTATRQGEAPRIQMPSMRSTTLRIGQAKRDTTMALPEKVGRHSKRVDAALPGKPTRQLYDHLSRKEAVVLS